MATKTSKKQQNRIRIKLKSYDAANLDASTKQIVEALKEQELELLVLFLCLVIFAVIVF